MNAQADIEGAFTDNEASGIGKKTHNSCFVNPCFAARGTHPKVRRQLLHPSYNFCHSVRNVRSRANSEGGVVGEGTILLRRSRWFMIKSAIPFHSHPRRYRFSSHSPPNLRKELNRKQGQRPWVAHSPRPRGQCALQAECCGQRQREADCALCISGLRFSSAPSSSVSKVTEDPLLGDRMELGETCSYQTLSFSWELGGLPEWSR